MRPIWKILIVAAAIIAVVAALLVIPHYRAKVAVARYREQLGRQGEKMSIAELTPSTSAEDVSRGRELVAAASMISYFTNSPPMMRYLSPGHAMVGWEEVNSATEKTTNCWPEFSAVIKERPDIVKQIGGSLQGPGLAVSIDYNQQGLYTPLMYLMYPRRASTWLSGATMLCLHEGDTNGAWESLRCEAELVRKYNGELLIVSQMVRAGLTQTALATTWEALQYPGWSDAQLGELETNWASFNLLDQLEPALSMEREICRNAFPEVRSAFSNYSDLTDSQKSPDEVVGEIFIHPSKGIPAYLGRHPRFWMWKWFGSYDEELYDMQITQAALEAVRNAKKNDTFIPALAGYDVAVTNIQKNHPGWERRYVIATGLADELSRGMLRVADTETGRRMVVTAIALERYRRRHGEYPARLEELTPDILQKVPIDFMDGKPLRYRRKEDGTFLFYSVGEDGKDDGGDSSPPSGYKFDVRAWYRMRDAVWPMPATADEVTKYEAGMLQKLIRKPPGKLVPQIVPKPAGTNAKTN